MAIETTELMALIGRDASRSAQRLREGGCLVDGADLARVESIIATAFAAPPSDDPGGYEPESDACDALFAAGLLSDAGRGMCVRTVR